MDYTVSETALVTIAAAVVIQTLLFVAVAIGSLMAMRRMQTSLKAEYTVLQARLDDAMGQVRSAVASVNRVSHEASDVAHHAGQVIGDVGGAVKTAAALVATPRAWMAAGAATGLRALLRRWPRVHRAH
jgi:predicted GTPase